jgi:phosphinothricin acetyltransferase
MSFEFKIREAKICDIKQIRDIFSYYVENTVTCLEEIVPSEDDLMENFSTIVGKNLPFYVALEDKKIVGYCYISPYRKRASYRYTVEDSIYIHPNYHKKGIARALLDKAITKCSATGYKQMVAVVVSESSDSIRFHKSMGFEEVGRLNKVGFKKGQWLDTIFLQKEL